MDGTMTNKVQETPEDPVHITWDREKYNRLYTDVQHAIKQGMTSDHIITFDGHKLVLGYAKYLLEYVDQQLLLINE
jgi:hypothetical protein